MDALRQQIEDMKKLLTEATSGPWEAEVGWNNAGCPTSFFKIPGHNEGATVEILARDAAFIVGARNDLLSLLEQVEGRIARLERENYDLQRRIHDEDGLQRAMQRNGYGTVNKPPKRRF